MDTVVLVGRLLVSLAVVLGVLWLVARRMNRRGGRGRQSPIEVLGRHQLGRHSAVAVVRVAEQTLVLGVTEGSVSLLTTAEIEDASASAADERPSRVPARRATDVRVTASGAEGSSAARTSPVAAPEIGQRSVAAGSGSAPSRSASSRSASSGSAPSGSAPSGSSLTGSALSPGTWRQTVDALRDLTARSG